MRAEALTVGTSRLHLLPVVRGLVSESAVVRRAFTEVGPDAVALSISREELRGLKAQPEIEADPSNVEEEVYVRELSRFGAVRKPPPCFVEALKLCTSADRPIFSLDLDDAAYTEAFVHTVSTVELIRQGFARRRLRQTSFPADSPEDLVRDIDRVVTQLRGYRDLEAEREKCMAATLRGLAGRYRSVLALVEVERSDGVRRLLG